MNTVSKATIDQSIDDIVLQIRREKVIPILGYDLLFNELEKKRATRNKW